MGGVIEVVGTLLPQDWHTSFWVLLLTITALFTVQLAWRPSFAAGAPPVASIANLPILGAWRYYQDRFDFFRENQSASRTGNFSFYVGKKQVVAVAGHDGRKTFFDTKELHPGPGYAALFAGVPVHPDIAKDTFGPWFTKTLIYLMKGDNFVKNLDHLTGDARRSCERLADAPASPADPEWRVMDPFDAVYNMVYQLTMRTVGCREVAESPQLLARTLHLFESLDSMKSTLRFFFPWLPTINHLRRMYAGIQLHIIFSKIVDERRKTGRKEKDAFQHLIDSNTDNTMILQFVIASLFAGQINSGINSAWVLSYLAMHPEWKSRVQAEIDGVVAKFRRSRDQSRTDVLGTLSLEDWENEFRFIDLCLRETIRLGLPGTSFRTNISGRDIPIGNTDEVVPPGAHVVYLIDDAHLNPEIYSEPTDFDPGRFLEGREEDKKKSNAYAGWGLGRHPCLGMRFAKLEMNIILAYFMAMFDFELSDSQGNATTKWPLPIDRNQMQAQKPADPHWLRYKPRV